MQDHPRPEPPTLTLSRADSLWIALRFFGLFLLFLALQHLVSILAGLASMGASAVFLPELGLGFQAQMLISSGIRLVIFVALGVYLLRDGKAVFKGLWALTSPSARRVAEEM